MNNHGFRRELPEANELVRQSLYRGTLYLLPATEASVRLADETRQMVESSLGSDFRRAQFGLGDEEFFAVIGRLRKEIYTAVGLHRLVSDVIDSLGFAAAEHAFDPARLRVVSHDGHLNPAAAPIYYGHRDTWYSNPQAMITWWIPLHDIDEGETFDFFTDEFSRVVDNDSEIFDFERWVAKDQDKRIGWQDINTGRTARYPQLLQEPGGPRLPVTCRAGQVLLFSAQHLHKTRHNQTGRTRFSLDFRTVHLQDHASGISAANLDNRSTGSSLAQFVRPADWRTS